MLKIVWRHITVVLLSLLLSACGTNNIRSDFQVANSTDNGVVIGSFVMDPSMENALFYYRALGTKEIKWVGLNEWSNPFYKGDFKDETGKLFVLDLPEGNYEIHSWLIRKGAVEIGQGRNFSMKFSVAKGTVKYLGEIKIDVQYGQNFLGLPIPGSGALSIHDRRERDLAVAAQNYPALALNNVAFEILDKSGSSTEVGRGAEVSIPVPVKTK